MFVVRDDDGHSDLLFQTSDTTWQAYNQLRRQQPLHRRPGRPGRAYKVSYNRPFTTRGTRDRGLGLQRRVPDGPLARGATATTSATSTGVDTDRRGARARCEHKAFLSVGHDEYWSGDQRANVEAARDAGVNLAFFSGNEVFWKTRWEPASTAPHATARWSPTRRRTPTRRSIRPADVDRARGATRAFSPPADGGRPENALTGTIFTVNSRHRCRDPGAGRGRQAAVLAQHRVAEPAGGRRPRRSPPSTLGYEWDEDLDNGSGPPG